MGERPDRERARPRRGPGLPALLAALLIAPTGFVSSSFEPTPINTTDAWARHVAAAIPVDSEVCSVVLTSDDAGALEERWRFSEEGLAVAWAARRPELRVLRETDAGLRHIIGRDVCEPCIELRVSERREARATPNGPACHREMAR